MHKISDDAGIADGENEDGVKVIRINTFIIDE